jgi:LysM repeat protein
MATAINQSTFVSQNVSFATLVNQVSANNGLKNPNGIRVGQVISLPDGSTVTVQKGDTLSGIVDNWKTNTETQAQPTPQPEASPPAPVQDNTPAVPAEAAPIVEAPSGEPAFRVDITGYNKPPPIKVDTPSGSNKVAPLRANPLSAFSSSTYNISLYMINPDTYNLYSKGQKIPNDWKLICRSGGIQGNTTHEMDGSVSSTSQFGERAEGFELDCYIDNLVIKTAISSKETLSACNSFDFTFQIHEPYGFSLPTRLIKAASKVQAASKIQRSVNESITALQTQYLLVIRFYGYDKDGNVMKSSDRSENVTDPSASFERSFPITIYGFDFKLDPKMVTYNVKAKLANEQYALGQTKLKISENITLTGETVKDVLQGSDENNKKQNIVGLMQRLNEIQQRKLDLGEIEVKDTWAIKFEPNTGIEDAELVDVDFNPNEKSPNTPVTSVDSVNVKLSSRPAVIQKKYRPISVNSSDNILQVIEQVISQSTYVTKALKIKPSEEFQEAKEGDKNYEQNDPGIDTISWYSVIPSATLGKFDNKRKQFATDITYIIKKYAVPYIRGLELGKRTPYYGPVKRYKHWFMSDDTKSHTHEKEIISYDVNYNLLYFNLAGVGNDWEKEQTDDPAPNEKSGGGSNTQGKAPGWYDKAVGPFKTFLYSPADQIKAKIVILGDPDYLMTSTSKGYQEAITKWFGTDQSINPNSGQVFIEIEFRDAIDYSPSTGSKADGLLNPSKDGDILFWKYPDSIKKDVQGTIYMVWQVISTFNKGVFQQELKVCIPPFVSDKSDAKNAQTSATAREPNLASSDASFNQALANATTIVPKTKSSTSDQGGRE